MNSRARKTLDAIFATPPRRQMVWADIEALFVALGAAVNRSAEGSRVEVKLNGRRAVFHEPHPRKETGARTIKDVREFLTDAGVTP